jgi:hypothetical protein
MSTKIIEIKNIVVGDLPYDQMRGDFYVAISVGTNPDMVTSLQEEKMPKVVHFPEILQLKIRDSHLEPRIHITVKELNVIGSETLCELIVSTSAVIDWSEDETPLKRFQMKVLNSDIERATPPWIAMEFGQPTEARTLDHLPSIWSMMKVRTFLPVNSEQYAAATRAHAGPGGHTDADRKSGSIMLSDGSLLGTREVQDYDTTAFKYKYQLLDDSGNPVEEPDERDLAKIYKWRHRYGIMYGCTNFIVFAIVFAYAAFRFYVWSCYRQFVWLTEAYLNNMTFPVPDAVLKNLVKKCHEAVDGTGLDRGLGTPCRPNYAETLRVCNNIPDANRPEAFVGLIYNWFGIKIKGPPCFHGVCAFRNQLVNYDTVCIIGAIALIIFTRCCKWWADYRLKAYKRDLQSKHGEMIKNMRTGNTARTQTQTA